MLREIVRDMQQNKSHTLSEILVRIVLLTAVCLMYAHLHPHVQYLTETELLENYKKPRRVSYIPPWLMIFLTIILPLITLSIPSMHTKNNTETTQALLSWSLSCAITAFLTETGKLIVGRPRPDFFFRCFPNGKVTKDLRCTGTLREEIEGRKSFPSGHSSFAFCSLGFVSVWMCGKLGVLSRSRGNGVRIVSCLAPLVVSSLVAMSRCCDHHHHWEDIVAGAVVGFSSSYFCYRQYFHPLDSEASGKPYFSNTKQIWSESASEVECCTRDLDTESLNKEKYN